MKEGKFGRSRTIFLYNFLRCSSRIEDFEEMAPEWSVLANLGIRRVGQPSAGTAAGASHRHRRLLPARRVSPHSHPHPLLLFLTALRHHRARATYRGVSDARQRVVVADFASEGVLAGLDAVTSSQRIAAAGFERDEAGVSPGAFGRWYGVAAFAAREWALVGFVSPGLWGAGPSEGVPAAGAVGRRVLGAAGGGFGHEGAGGQLGGGKGDLAGALARSVGNAVVFVVAVDLLVWLQVQREGLQGAHAARAPAPPASTASTAAGAALAQASSSAL